MSGIFDQIINYSPPLIVSGTVNYKGTWNASTNNPTLNSSPASSTKGDYYVVSTAGTQFGITFAIGDWIISNGTAWEKVDLTDAVSSVFGRTGAVVGVSTDYSAVGLTNTAIGASNPSTGAFTTVTASSTISATGAVTGSNLSGTNTGDQTTITGNAGTATALQTARTIGGSSFDGTANVTSFPVPGAIGVTTPAAANFTSIGVTTQGTGAFTTLSASGNLNFTGTANRITGDFSNATFANRVAFQSSTTNGNTGIFILPNGTAGSAAIRCANNSDPTNAAFVGFDSTPTEARVTSGITGTGTYLPMTFYTGGSERMRIDTSGNTAVTGALSATGIAGFGCSSSTASSIAGAGVAVLGQTATETSLVRVAASSYLSGPTFTATSLGQNGGSATGTTCGLTNASLGAIYFQNTSAGVIWSNGEAPIVFGISSVERGRFNTTGLAVTGTLSATGAVSVTSSLGIAFNTFGNVIKRLDADGALQITSGQSNINLTPATNVIVTQGNVGIGTTSPATKLDVSGHVAFGVGSTSGFNVILREYTTGTVRNWTMRDDGGVNRLRFSRGNSDQAFWDVLKVAASDQTGDQFWYTFGAQRMQLSSTGLAVTGTLTTSSTTLHTSSVSLTNGAAAALGTLTNAPVAGNPTKWIPIVDNGVTRYIPCW